MMRAAAGMFAYLMLWLVLIVTAVGFFVTIANALYSGWSWWWLLIDVVVLIAAFSIVSAVGNDQAPDPEGGDQS